MTAIVGFVEKGKVWLGGDRATIDSNYGSSILAEPKVFIHQCEDTQIGFGCSGYIRIIQLLKHGLIIPPLPSRNAGRAELDRWVAIDFTTAVRQCFRDHAFMRIENNVEDFHGNYFIMGLRGCIYQVESNLQSYSHKGGMVAIGCGGDIAMGALHILNKLQKKMKPQDRLRHALEASAKYNAGVHAPFNIIQV